MQPCLRAPFVSHSLSLPPASAFPTLFWNPSQGWWGPTWTLGMCWEISCGRVATIRDLGGFWDTDCVCANNGHPAWAPVSPIIPPTSKGGLSPPCRTTGLGCPFFGLTCSLPRVGVCPCNLPFPLSRLPGAQVPNWSLFFPSYPITYASFLQPWLLRSPSSSFKLVFSENYSTCRCIFYVFLWGGELHILLSYSTILISTPSLISLNLCCFHSLNAYSATK